VIVAFFVEMMHVVADVEGKDQLYTYEEEVTRE